MYDSYIRSIRWASDRIGESGIIGFVTNASFIRSETGGGTRLPAARIYGCLGIWSARQSKDTR